VINIFQKKRLNIHEIDKLCKNQLIEDEVKNIKTESLKRYIYALDQGQHRSIARRAIGS
jgi:hypothetical protein